ncbi:MAG: lipocalin family protein [Burkholderiaceae bacterium]
MAASLDDLKTQIEAAERVVHAADARASEAARSLKAHWRARGPTMLIGAASALLAFQLVRGRRHARTQAHGRAAGSWTGAFEQLLRLGGPRLTTIASALVAGLVAKKAKKPLSTAPSVDLQQYAGTWYEIARLPGKYEKDCASDVTATYEGTIDGGLRIINRCRRRDGSVKRAIGRAEVVDADTSARLRVSFAPQLLDALPFVWSDYYIMDVASDYSMAVVGTPDRARLWLLSRDTTVTEEVRSSFIAKALGQGFDTSQLIYVRHTGYAGAGGAEESASFPGGGVEPSGVAPIQAAAPSPPTPPHPESAAETTPPTDYDRLATRVHDKQP